MVASHVTGFVSRLPGRLRFSSTMALPAFFLNPVKFGVPLFQLDTGYTTVVYSCQHHNEIFFKGYMMRFMGKEIELPIMVSAKETLGQRLRKVRKSRGFSQTELAEVISSSQRAICSYEQDRTAPPAHLLPKIAKAFGISLDALMGLEPNDISSTGARSSRWNRKFEQIEKLPERKQRTILQVIDMAMKSVS